MDICSMATVLILDKPEDQQILRTIIREELAGILQSLPAQTAQQSDNILTREDVAKKFKVLPETISSWFDDGKLNGFRLGGRLYFFESVILEGLKKIQVKRKRRLN